MTQQAVPRVLRALVDDAGLFPPTGLPMEQALARHRHDAQSGSAMLTQRFLCPVPRLPELLRALDDDEHVDVGLIAAPGARGLLDSLAAAEADPRVAVRSVDIPGAGADEVRAAVDVATQLPDGVEAWVEVRRGPGWLESVRGLPAGSRVGAKLRCGGADAAAFPSPEEVADFIATCAAAGLAFKATAGLHAAARGVDPDDGLLHHGFLNILVAAARTARGTPPAQVVEVLSSTDATALADEVRLLSDSEADALRSLFVSYGSCSTAAPVAEATALGLLR